MNAVHTAPGKRTRVFLPILAFPSAVGLAACMGAADGPARVCLLVPRFVEELGGLVHGHQPCSRLPPAGMCVLPGRQLQLVHTLRPGHCVLQGHARGPRITSSRGKAFCENLHGRNVCEIDLVVAVPIQEQVPRKQGRPNTLHEDSR